MYHHWLNITLEAKVLMQLLSFKHEPNVNSKSCLDIVTGMNNFGFNFPRHWNISTKWNAKDTLIFHFHKRVNLEKTKPCLSCADVFITTYHNREFVFVDIGEVPGSLIFVADFYRTRLLQLVRMSQSLVLAEVLP